MNTTRSLEYLPRAIYYFTVVAALSVCFSVAVSSITMGAAIILAAARLIISKGKAFKRTPFDIILLAYLAAEALATIFSVEPSSSLFNMKRFFLFSLLYLGLITADSRKKLLAAIAAVTGTAAIVSLMEFFSLSTSAGHFLRVSLFQYFMTEGGIKMIALLLALPFVIHKETPVKWRIYFLLSGLILLLGLVLTQTRSSWLGFLTGSAAMAVAVNRKMILALLALILVFLIFAPSDFRERADSIFDPTHISNITRLHMITTGWKMFLDRPLTGYGDIDLRKIYVTYTTPLLDSEGGHLHNNIMMLLATLGIIGFVPVMILFVKIFTAELSAFKANAADWLTGSTALGCFSAYLGFQVNGLFEWNFGDHEIAVLIWFTVGLSMATLALGPTRKESGGL